jgi:hypothetical protein
MSNNWRCRNFRRYTVYHQIDRIIVIFSNPECPNCSESLKSDEDFEKTPGVSIIVCLLVCLSVEYNYTNASWLVCFLERKNCITEELLLLSFFVQYFPDKFVRRDIDALEMVCVYAEKGCDWEGTFGKLKVFL